MSNIGNLVDRTFREYLEPMDDIVSYTTLSTGINDSVTSVVFNGDLLICRRRRCFRCRCNNRNRSRTYDMY